MMGTIREAAHSVMFSSFLLLPSSYAQISSLAPYSSTDIAEISKPLDNLEIKLTMYNTAWYLRLIQQVLV
jgi:hypothetical protein